MDERVDLEAVQGRADAATEGPWAWEQVGEKDNTWCVGYVVDDDDQPLTGLLETGQGVVVEGVCEGIDGNQADGAFIAHARSDIPALIAELRQAREVLRRIYELLSQDGYAVDSAPLVDIREVLTGRHDPPPAHDPATHRSGSP